MDIFKFNNPTAPTKMEQGEILNGFSSKLWIERYALAGEFALVSNISAGMREKLPVGSFISHVESQEVMMVENHELVVNRGKEPELKITGSGFETFFVNRIVGSNDPVWPAWVAQVYVVGSSSPQEQVLNLIKDHIMASELVDDNDQIPYTDVTYTSGGGFSEERTFKAEDLYTAVQTVLAANNLGIKVVRPGLWSPLGAASPNTAFVVHSGVDRTSDVVFSYDTGEIESADYLWTNKKFKNAALIIGTWLKTRYVPAATGIDRRWMLVDGSDIDADKDISIVTTPGAEQDAVNAAMIQRGIDSLVAQKDVELSKAEVSKDVNKPGYRTDFNVGDIIAVEGDYNASSIMRISEYVEIEDENGQKGYPTLINV